MLATLLPFDNAIGAPGLPAGSPLIYLTVIALAAGWAAWNESWNDIP